MEIAQSRTGLNSNGCPASVVLRLEISIVSRREEGLGRPCLDYRRGELGGER